MKVHRELLWDGVQILPTCYGSDCKFAFMETKHRTATTQIQESSMMANFHKADLIFDWFKMDFGHFSTLVTSSLPYQPV